MVIVADLPYEEYGCDERGYVSGGSPAAAGARAAASPAVPSADPAPPPKPWWMFWK
jgi:hypothetical protein